MKWLAWVGIVGWILACGSSEGGGGAAGSSIENACRLVATYPCANDSVAECVVELGEDRADAAAVGCADEFDAFVRCVAEGVLLCGEDEDGPELLLPSACVNLRSASNACISGGAPPVGTIPPAPPSSTPCGSSCVACAVECSGAGPFSCTCSAGQNTGRVFAIDTCAELAGVVAEQCG